MSVTTTTTTMQAVETVLNKKIKSELAIAFPNLEVFQENQHGDTPPVEKTGDFSEYVKLTVNYGVPLQDSRVSAKRPGIATVQIFTPLGTGTGRAIEIFQVLQGKLSYVQWAEQALATSSVSFLKVGKTGSHYQSNVDIFFEYAESNI